MNFDFIGILILLRLIALVMLITIVIVTNVFTGFGAFVTYFLNGILFLLLGIIMTRSELKSNHVTGVFGPFVGILGVAYTVGSIVNANALAAALGNGFTPAGRIFYGASFIIALTTHLVSKRYFLRNSTGDDSTPEDDS